MRQLKKLEKRPPFLFLFDFDGTLSPIAKKPGKAILPPDTRSWLRRLSRRRSVKVGIVTGRSLSDIKRRVGLKNIIYAANHGMEISYNGKLLLRKGHSYRKPLQELAGKLRSRFSNTKSVIVENKKLSVAVHFRKVKAGLRPAVRRAIRALAMSYIKKYDLQLTTGKMILEIRPERYWNKGNAVLWIWHRLAPKYTPVYVGDDMTDEKAFLAVKSRGLGIRIGKKKKSHARYCISSITAITRPGIFL